MSPRRSVFIGMVAAAVVFAVIIGITSFMAIDRSGKIAVQVSIIPRDATFSINSQSYSTDTTVYLKEGEYQIKAAKDGFAAVDEKTYISQNNKTLTLSLAPQSDEAKTWAENNADQYRQNEGISGEASAETGESFREKNPIVNELPYKNLLYTIGYRADPADKTGNSIIITIDTFEGYRQAAIYRIQQMGFNPADYKYEFKNHKDPFAS